MNRLSYRLGKLSLDREYGSNAMEHRTDMGSRIPHLRNKEPRNFNAEIEQELIVPNREYNHSNPWDVNLNRT